MINASGDGACVAARPGTFDAGDVRVKEGKVENAFVWVSAGLEEYGFETPAKEIVVDQRGCMYQPRVLGAQTGQPIVFLNSDETIHNIKASPKSSKGWNFATPPKGRGAPKSLSKQEVMVKLGCDVHPWMTAWVGVVDHPFFALTDAEGKFQLAGLPKGSYTVSAWHERLGSTEMKVVVDAPAAVELSLPGEKR
jgi:plastocyanin